MQEIRISEKSSLIHLKWLNGQLVLRFKLGFLVEFVLDEAALSTALKQFDIAINILKITRFTSVRQDFENLKFCLQNLEYSRLVSPARFAKFEKFIDLAGMIKKIPNLADKIWKIQYLAGNIWKIQNPASKIWKIQDLAGKIWKIQDLATHHSLTGCSITHDG